MYETLTPALIEQDASEEAAPIDVAQFWFSSNTVERGWLIPLFEAAAAVATNTQALVPAKFTTVWDPQLGDGGDAQKHDAFLRYAFGAMTERLPWLVSLAATCGATFIYARGACKFAVPTRPGESFDIPELAPFLSLVPWLTEEDEFTPKH